MKNSILEDEASRPKSRAKSKTASTNAQRIAGVLVGRLVAVGSSGEACVEFPENTTGEPLPALSIVSLDAKAIGKRAVLMFEEGDPGRPIIMGLVEQGEKAEAPAELTVDKQRVELIAEQEIILRCGKASITLTRAGKVLIRGAYVLSRSSGANRIKGGSVQIN